MANVNVNIRMDSDLKHQFEKFCEDMGLTMSTAFNIFAKKAVREYRIPFEISGENPNSETKELEKTGKWGSSSREEQRSSAYRKLYRMQGMSCGSGLAAHLRDQS